MSRTLTLNLSAAEIKQAVKSDTYITGQMDKSADMTKNAALAYNEQAGNEDYHETKLFRTMKGALAKFESQVAEYVETSLPTAVITDTLTDQTTVNFTITLTVGDRMTAAFATPLAYLAQEYIINMMLYQWWQPIKPTLAKDYIAFANDNLADVKRCLTKSAPASTTTSYSDISGSVKLTANVSFPESEYSVTHGSTFVEPEVTTSPVDLDLTYTSSDEDVATVNGSGEVTVLSTGDTDITATFAGNDTYASASATYTLHVEPLEEETIDPIVLNP